MVETKLETSILSLWSSSLVTNSSFKDLSSGAKLEQYIHVELEFLKLEFYRTICRWQWRRIEEPDQKPESKEEFGEARTKGRIWRSKIEKQRFGEAEEGSGEADPKKQMIWNEEVQKQMRKNMGRRRRLTNSLIQKKIVELES